MYCTEDCKCSLCRELRGFDYRRELNRSKKFKLQKEGNFRMKKAQSTFELAQPHDYGNKFKDNKYPSTTDLANPGQKRNPEDKHKVIIYFSDAFRPNSGSQSNLDVDHAKRLAEEIQKKQSTEKLNENCPRDFVKQLKTVLEEKSKTKPPVYDRPAPKPPTVEQQKVQKQQLQQKLKPTVPPKKTTENANDKPNAENQTKDIAINQSTFTKIKPLPSYIESIENNVIKLKIEQNFKKASELVDLIASYKKRKKTCIPNTEDSSVHELNFSRDGEDMDEEDDEETASEPDEGFYYDWSFVQEWRSR